MDRRIETLDKQMKPIFFDIGAKTAIFAFLGFSIGATVRQVPRCTILGASIGSGYGFSLSNEKL